MRTNNFSRKCFFNALLKLSKRKQYDEIQIKDICEEAGYNKSTFYRIYTSKEDLLVDGFKTILAQEYYATAKSGVGEVYIDNVRLLFSYIRKNKEIFLMMHDARLDYKLYELMCSVFPLPTEYKEGRKYYLAYQASGYLFVIIEWLLGGMNESDEYMADLIAEIIEKSSIYKK